VDFGPRVRFEDANSGWFEPNHRLQFERDLMIG